MNVFAALTEGFYLNSVSTTYGNTVLLGRGIFYRLLHMHFNRLE
jgi:hypothetical protein